MLIRKFFECSVDVKCYLLTSKTYCFAMCCSAMRCSAMRSDSTKSAMKRQEVHVASIRTLSFLPT